MINNGDKIAVVMITLNEQKAIRKVVNDIRSVDPRIEIIIVDSSTDETPKIAKTLGIKVIRQFPAMGYGPAMDVALKASNKEVIITLDCDDTYPVDQIKNFSNFIFFEGYDVVDGNRLSSKPKNMPFINFIANYLFALIASILFFERIYDLHSGMRAYKKKIIGNIPYLVDGVSLPVELILWPIRLGYKVKFVNINYKERLGISKLEPLKAAWWTVIRILRARFAKKIN